MSYPPDPLEPRVPYAPPVARPVRPLGVVLSAVALGLAALLLVFLSLGSLIALAGGAALANPGTAALPSGALHATLLLVLFVYLGLASWAIATLVGLLRMRSWARLSAMVIAACVSGFSLLGALGTLGAQSMLQAGSANLPANVTPAMLHGVFVGMAMVSIVLAVLGIVWLVYLAKRSTREAFALAKLAQDPTHANGSGQMLAADAAFGRPVRPAPPAPDPLTDFTVARPLAPPLPAVPVDPSEPTQPS